MLKRFLCSALVGASVLGLSPASAAVVTYGFNFTSTTDAADTGAANTVTFSSTQGGQTITATITGWNATQQSNGSYTITQSYVGKFKPGLGVTSANDDLAVGDCASGGCGTHQIDNLGNTANSLSYDFLQIAFSQAVTLGSVDRYAYGTANAALNNSAFDDDFSYGKYSGTLVAGNTYTTSNLGTLLQTTSADNGACTPNSSGYCFESTAVSQAANATASTASKNWYISAAIGSNYGGDGVVDAFKLSGVNAYAASVPEPGSWAMMILGFGVIGYGMRRKERRGLVFGIC